MCILDFHRSISSLLALSISRRFRCCFFEIYTHHHRDYSAKIERVSFSESNKHANKIYTNRFLILYIFLKY